MKRIEWYLAPTVFIVFLLSMLWGGYLLFHTVVELFAIVVAFIMFVVAWYSYRFTGNPFLMFLGIAYFWVANLDLIHTLSYKDMNILPGISSGFTIDIWIITRYLEAFSLLIAPLFLDRLISRFRVFFIYALIVSTLLLSAVMGWLPATFIEGQGLTTFKIYSEYFIIMVLAGSIYFLYQRREFIDDNILKLMVAAISLTMMAEVAFTLYSNLFEVSLVVGHMLKFLSFWLVFVAIIKTTLTEPFDVLSRSSSTYDAINTPIILVDGEGIITQVNQAAYHFVGKGVSDVIGQDCHQLLHDQTLSKDSCAVCQHIVDGQRLDSYEMELPEQRRSFHVSLTPISIGDRFTGMIHSMQDITERVFASKKLAQSEEMFRQLAENIQEVFWVSDPKKKEMVYVSPAYEALWGRDIKDLYEGSISFIDAIHHDDKARILSALYKQALGEYDENYRIIQPNGEIRWINDRAFPVTNEAGEVYRVVGIASDLTHQIEGREAVMANKAKSEFLSRMSHELRTPLNAILGFAQLLNMKKENNWSDDDKDNVDEIMTAGKHLLDLINDVLELSRIETGSLDIELQPVPLNELIRSCITMVVPLANQKNVIIQDKISAESDYIIDADARYIKQVMLNLLSNAIKYNRDDGEVECSCQLIEDNCLRISIKDTGIGIAHADSEQVFKPFSRINEKNSTIEGTGIGLVITKNIIEAMDGHIGYESEINKGSHFWVDVRLADISKH